MAALANWQKLRAMTDEEVQDIWDAILGLDGFDRAALDVEWQEDVYFEISSRGLRSGRK